MAADIAKQIRKRADAVRMLGEYVGFFEFMVWSSLRKRELLLLFGQNLVNIHQVFGTPLSEVPLSNTCRVAAVLLKSNGTLQAASGHPPVINHYVIAVTIVGAAQPDVLGEWPDALAQRSGTAAVAARKAGLALKVTDTTGDCGIDCMAYYDGESRTSATFVALRGELADFMVANRADPAWQSVFRICQEAPVQRGEAAAASSKGCLPKPVQGGMGPPVAPPCSSLSSSSSSSASGSSTAGSASSGGPAMPPPPLPPPAESPPPASQPAHPPPPVDSLTSSAPAAGPLLEDHCSLIVHAGKAGLADASGDKASLADASGDTGSFLDWLRARPKDELMSLVCDYKTWKATEEKWLAERGPRQVVKKNMTAKQRSDTTLRFRYATAEGYQHWRAHAGETSKAPLKDLVQQSSTNIIVKPRMTDSWRIVQHMGPGFMCNICPGN
jgi:hypothetical protein